ncbi:ATP-dependent DNA helicase PIF1 [Paramuricea clavata]|uniref:ATP-dependent DNA helicase PIF1 n=1 Tax=Paramuricea clavata TaxID=317549 RepID=A0A7D9HKJ1_PARCT|nr:ATP-dependent DNA helicase PIF1 [Paramuricea clavata]
MKKIEYMVCVHILQGSGNVCYAKCQCPARKEGVCKHVAAILFQILEFKELELSEVPDDISCTEKLQKWKVPATGNEMKGNPEGYKAAPSFAEKVLNEDVKRLRNGVTENDINSPLVGVLDDNDCNPFDYELWHNNLPSKLRIESKRKVISGVNSENVRVVLNGLAETLYFNILSQTA